MDQDKVNPFVGNTEAPAGGAPVSDASASGSSTAASGSTPSVPVNPYAPAGAPYAPGSNTPAPDFATPYSGGTYDSPDTAFSNDPAVPNTGAYTSFSPAPSQDPVQFSNTSPEKPKLFTKKFIIFASIGVVLVIVTVVVGIIVQNNSANNNGTKSSSSNAMVNSDYQNALNSYINYITSGSTSSENRNFAYDGNTDYFLASKLYNYTTNISGQSEAKTVIANAQKYFEVYYGQITDEEKKTSMNGSAVSPYLYREILSLVEYIVSNQPSDAEISSSQFVQGLDDFDLGPAEVYKTLYNEYTSSNNSEDSKGNLNNFINSYANYLIYNCPELNILAKGEDNK